MGANGDARPGPGDPDFNTALPNGQAGPGATPASGLARAGESADGCVITDRVGLIEEADEGAARLLDTRREFLPGKPFPLYLAEAYWPTAYTLINQAVAAGGVAGWRTRLRPRRASRDPGIPIALSMGPVRGGSFEVRLRWLISDLRQNTWAERALIAERAFADDLMEAAQALVLVLDEGGRIVRCNPYTVALSGRAEQELVGQEWARALLPPEDRGAALAVLRQALTGHGGTLTAQLQTAGPARTVFWSVRAVARSEGGYRVFALGHDISELREAQQRALHAERLAAIGQVTAALAHESRNLLQSAQANLERLAWRLADAPEALDLAERARRSHQRLLRLFEDVRQYSAPLRLELAPCPLPALWREAWEAARALSPEKEAELTEDAEGDPFCQADRFRLQQVLRNIFENSLAACPGKACVRVTCRGAARDGHPAWQVSVRDNGPGLGDEQRRRLFEPFYTTRPRGTGLGMAIARQIIQAHGGEIAVGDGGPGAEIILWLPRSGP